MIDTERELRVMLPIRLPWQDQVVAEARRYNVVDIGRQAGKTTLGDELVIDPALDGYPTAWFAPTYKDLLEVWSEIKTILRPVLSRASMSERRMELITGGVVEFWSLDNTEDAGRGRRYKRIVVDEAAMVPHLVPWFEAAGRPTLSRFTGDAWFLSTPKGLNGFWNLYRRGQDPEQPDWRCWQMPTSVNPIMVRDMAMAKRELPDLVYRQEWLAEFVDMSGSVFRHVDEAMVSEPLERAEAGRTYCMGVDLARVTDYTVVTVLDTAGERARQVYLDRWQDIDWQLQIDRLVDVAERFRPAMIAVDQTGVGDMPVAELQNALPDAIVWGVRFNVANKTQMVHQLSAALERRELELLPDQVQAGELKAFEAKERQTGTVSYNAPAGMHDDTVAALMLALDIAQPGAGLVNLSA